VEKWINRMRNDHLPAKLGWIAYRFKLWAGVRYGLVVLATPLSILAGVLKKQNFWLLSFLGVNRNVKREWQTIHRAFGGIGLFSFAIEQTIGMINVFVQHFKAGTTLAKKFTATLEALQLEIGCIGDPLLENCDNLGVLAMACWAKSFWEQLHFYRLSIHMEYPTLNLPRCNDALIVTMLQRAGYTGDKLIALNRCHIANKMLFLSDITKVCRQYVDCNLLSPTTLWLGPRSTLWFSWELPSSKDWILWKTFWTAFLGADFLLHIPLDDWIHMSHRIWERFHDPLKDQLQHLRDNVRTVYNPVKNKQNTRYTQVYSMQYMDALPAIGNPCNVRQILSITFHCRETGMGLAPVQATKGMFWEHLRSLGGTWMWEYIKEGKIDMVWLRDMLRNGMLISITDGSFDRHKAKSCSGLGWILVCTASK
jgi:hypothetical protein